MLAGVGSGGDCNSFLGPSSCTRYSSLDMTVVVAAAAVVDVN